MFEAIIFDFDGVILDSEPIHYEACCSVFNHIGLTLTYDEYTEKYIGLSDKEMFPQLLMDKGYNFSLDEINSFINKKIETYADIINSRDQLPIISGVDQYICDVIQGTKKMAICSGSTKKEVVTVLKKLKQGKLQSYFNTIVTAEDVKFGKPSPEGYLLTAKQLGVPTNKCLVIEDSPYGVEAAKAAGMYVIAILTTHERRQLQRADKIADDFTNLDFNLLTE